MKVFTPEADDPTSLRARLARSEAMREVAEECLLECVNVLQWINAQGGLGFEKHGAIQRVLGLPPISPGMHQITVLIGTDAIWLTREKLEKAQVKP